METSPEHCANCGVAVYAFSKKIATSDDTPYCIRCAEELDIQYLAKNTCSVCTRLLEREELKFVMPSRLFSNYFFDKLPMQNRLMCTHCYARARKLNLLSKPLIKIERIRQRLKRAVVKEVEVETKELAKA
ncbi:MAG: hypothetical protein ACHQX1_03000 [Candidatus Micrarchaeales archaeon]